MAVHSPPRSPEVIERAHHAKSPKTNAAGPYGHPFHPILVTVPIGAWICSVIFDVATKLNERGAASLVDASYWLIAIGVIGAVVAAAFGLLDLLNIPRGTPAMRTGLTHLALNLSVVAMFVINFIWRTSTHRTADEVRIGQAVLSIVAVAVLAVSGWLGGKLSYRYGVRVADEDTQAEGFS
jgi:uncharacterized membrane protein